MRLVYGLGVFLFFAVVLGIPAAIWIYEPPTCYDGEQNQGETAPDKGGPCPLLDERLLNPSTILWARAFSVRGGLYNAVAYIENPNVSAGVRQVRYRLRLYDERNVLVAEREGATFLMPGGVTPVFEGAVNTGYRTVSRAFLALTSGQIWERMENAAKAISVGNLVMQSEDSTPRLEATVRNTSVAPILEPEFVAVVFNAAGNAFAASATTLTRLAPNESARLVFTWPDPFPHVVSRIDVLPVLPPRVVAPR